MTGTGVRDPEDPDQWLVAPWPADASFGDVMEHFHQASLARRTKDDSTARLLAFHKGLREALVAAPTDEDADQADRDWGNQVMDVAERAVEIFQDLYVVEFGRDPQAGEDHHFHTVKHRTGA